MEVRDFHYNSQVDGRGIGTDDTLSVAYLTSHSDSSNEFSMLAKCLRHFWFWWVLLQLGTTLRLSLQQSEEPQKSYIVFEPTVRVVFDLGFWNAFHVGDIVTVAMTGHDGQPPICWSVKYLDLTILVSKTFLGHGRRRLLWARMLRNVWRHFVLKNFHFSTKTGTVMSRIVPIFVNMVARSV